MSGGEFLIRKVSRDEIFTPEEFGEQEKAIAQTTRTFVQKEILPRTEAIERADDGLMPGLMKKAGALGLLMIGVPEEHGGLGLGEKMSTWASEIVAEGSLSFAITMTGHMGIGTQSILFSGNNGVKERYLPSLISGAKVGCFALTEPEYGSDALSARTTATLSPDEGHYILEGMKQFTTNAGFGGIFNVFAQVPGRGFTAFVLDGSSPGMSTGKEEKKMGLKGTSTRSLILDQVKVPAQDVLGEIGQGHVIALNVLNLGRIKVGACCTGLARTLIRESLSYARQRKQFGKPIAEFGLIQQKLARMAARLFAAESALYRTAGFVEDAVSEVERRNGSDERKLRALGQYAAECAIVKVQASEALDFVSDEAVQIFGGYGYIEEYPVAPAYRDARICRIFEGTNEINRLSIIDRLYRLDQKGTLPLMTQAVKAAASLKQQSAEPVSEIQAAKTLFLSLWAMMHEHVGTGWQEEQELLAMLADLAIDIYAAESAALRVEKIAHRLSPQIGALASLLDQLSRLNLTEAAHALVTRFLAALDLADADFNNHVGRFEKLLRRKRLNPIRLEREAAGLLLKLGGYPLPYF